MLGHTVVICGQVWAQSYRILSLVLLVQVAEAQDSLEANHEELFDVVSCYFPISFTPPPGNVHGITRDDLANALQTTLTCTSLFAPLFIPMLVEKLSSSLRSAFHISAEICSWAATTHCPHPFRACMTNNAYD